MTDPIKPLRVLFLSDETGGGHRASAEALGRQFQIHYPGSVYQIANLWTDHGDIFLRGLCKNYKYMSANPWQWKFIYHVSNNYFMEKMANDHAHVLCSNAIKERIQSFNPDVVISVHPTMNLVPRVQTQRVEQELRKYIPFYTVVTDLGSAHMSWFRKEVDGIFVASEKLYSLAVDYKGVPKHKIALTGLPIRHGFGIQAEKLKDRTTEHGKNYQTSIKQELGLETNQPMVLVMGGGEGVGSLSDIVNQLYIQLTLQGTNTTICVVCGRNDALKKNLETRNWAELLQQELDHTYKMGHFLGGRLIGTTTTNNNNNNNNMNNPNTMELPTNPGIVNVVGLGFVSNMPEYMVAADILVTKAGPGTIAEAASVGLPVMLTSFLPGQEAGNVDVVIEAGFGDYCEDPIVIAKQVGSWLQDSDRMKTLSLAAQKAGHPHAAADIAKSIGKKTTEVVLMNMNQDSSESSETGLMEMTKGLDQMFGLVCSQ